MADKDKKKDKKPKKVVISGSDEEADWLKHVEGGKYQRQDLKAHDDAAEKEQKKKK